MRGVHLIEAETANDDHEPPSDILDLGDIGTGETAKGFLDHVLGSVGGVQHPRCHAKEIGPLRAPGVRDPSVGEGEVPGLARCMHARDNRSRRP